MGLDAIVVIPAHDEEREIAGCLRALAAQTVPRSAFAIIVVLDACADQTAEVANATAGELELAITLLPGPGCGAGPARRAGMDLAAERLLARGRADGLIACTDADSRPWPDWLASQLAHVRGGAVAIAGLIELDPDEARRLPEAVLRRRDQDAARRLALIRVTDPDAAHHHFAGASLGVTAAAYRSVGGLEPVVALEDAAFGQRLEDQGIAILRAPDVRVRTSARRDGRAQRGLALDLAVSDWSARRRYRADAYVPDRLRARKRGTTVSVVVPTKECAETIAAILGETVAPLAEAGLVDEIVVVDADSGDGTAEIAAAAGARVIQQNEILSRYGPALGKGDAMWRAVWACVGDLVCFLDGDTRDPHPHHLQGLLGPLLTDLDVQLVKGTFDRPLQTGDSLAPHEGGRVTELMARPLLNLHEPRLAGFTQPLAGEFAARRELLESIPFPVGYGIEIAALLDALELSGLDALAESNLGTRRNRHQPLRALGEMAYAVLAAVERRRGEGRTAIGGHYLRPWDNDLIATVAVRERPPLRTLVPGSSPGLLRAVGSDLRGADSPEHPL
jgi:glucosyl-3-phosphoglycerate synthase